MEIDNETDPVADERFPNIVPFDPDQDEPSEFWPCPTKTMEEVNPQGDA